MPVVFSFGATECIVSVGLLHPGTVREAAVQPAVGACPFASPSGSSQRFPKLADDGSH